MVQVVVGIIRNDSHDVFIAKRQKKQFMPGFWELPGGKVEADEGQHDALKRCLLYTSPSPRDQRGSRMPSSA